MITLTDVIDKHLSLNKSLTISYQTEEDTYIEKTLDEIIGVAKKIALALIERFPPQSRILLIYNPGIDFIPGILGCFYAGMIAVPTFPLRNIRHINRLQTIIRSCDPVLILGNRQVINLLNESEEIKDLEKMATDELWDDPYDKTIEINIKRENQIAFLQYTSGSTGEAKGVMITHENLIHNLRSIEQCSLQHLDHTQTAVSWLPYQHDLGLINGIFLPLYKCANLVILSPVSVIENPFRWLKAISDFKAYHTAGPNFSYQLCVDKITQDELSTLDLSNLHCAALAAEPNRYETMQQFINKFGVCGFREEAYCVAYGLAENTVHVTSNINNKKPSYLFISKNQLAKGKIVLTENKDDSTALMSTGPLNSCHEILIVDPEKRSPCGKDTLGEIWIHSPSTAQGYWGKLEETKETFHATMLNDSKRYLRTGDLGFIHNNDLYLTGRKKDLIIINGCNIYPQDIETIVDNSHDFIKPDSTAAFSIERDGKEVIIVCAEIKRIHRNKDLREVVLKVRKAIAQSHNMLIYDVKLIKPNQSFKTTSGKIQRKATKNAYLSGTLECIELPNDSNSLPEKKLIERDLYQMISEVLHVIPVDPNQNFSDLGGTSIHATLLHKKIQDYLGERIKVPPTVVFEHPTLGELISFVHQEKFGNLGQQICKFEPKDEKLIQPKLSIAVVGVGCRLPGNINHLNELLSVLMEGKNTIESIPEWRWNVTAYDEKLKKNISYAGIIETMEWFDPDFFHISPKEAYEMDPQHRIMLEILWEALEDAAINPMTLKKKKIGIYIGCSNTDYHSFLIKNKLDEMSLHSILGNSLNVMSGRMAYFLGSQGPTETIDTACSSSLVAIHEACQSLRFGQSELALAGGINLLFCPENSVGLVRAKMLSPTHQCHPYSTSADGYVRSEGGGLVVLKRLDDAIRDNDHIYGVITGSAINQNGASSGLTVPNLNAQVSLLQEALHTAHLKPSDINYIEGQGSSTILGDTIEIRAIKAVFGNQDRQEPLYIGSVKSNIGHLEAASGIAGLLKILASMNHPHPVMIGNPLLKDINVQFDLEKESIEILKDHCPWNPHGNPRRAGVSSFGFSGTNAHVIVEEYSEQIIKDSSVTLPKNHLFVLSAKSLESLNKMIKSYINYLELTHDALEDICYTAAVGRFQFNYRLACQVNSKEELRTRLSQATVIKVKINNEIQTSTDLNELERSYLSGHEVDFLSYYKPFLIALKKVKLPFYSFNNKQYFVDNKINSLKSIKNKQNALTDSNTTNKLEKIVRKITLLDEGIHLDLDKTFQQLGIDSLMLLDLTQSINEHFTPVPEFNVVDLVQYGTINRLCDAINQSLASDKVPNCCDNHLIKKPIATSYKLRKVTEQPLVIANETQKRIVLLTEIYPISYNIGLILKINQKVDVDKLKSCIHKIVDNELIYKINFLKVDKELYQHIHYDRIIDIDDISGNADVVNQMKQKIYEPYDLYHSSLIRVSFAAHEADSHVLIACHHSISDLISCNILINKIFNLYLNGIYSSIEAKNYFDYSVHCHHLFKSTQYQAIENYWLSKYEPINHLSKIHSDKDSSCTHKDIQSLLKDASSLYEGIDKVSKDYSTSAFNLFFSAFLIFIHKLNDASYVTIGFTHHGRWSNEIASSQGFFTQTLPFIEHVSKHETPISLIKKVTEQLQTDSYHQPLNLSELSKKLQLKQIKNPFEIIFNYDSSKMAENFTNLEMIYFENGLTNYDLSFSWHKTNNQLQLHVKYNANAFSEEYIQVLCNQYLHIINQLILNPVMPVSLMTLSSPQERDFILSHLRGITHKEYIQTTIAEPIRNIINCYPEEPAVITPDETLTYREFSKRSNKIRSFLKEKNIDKGSIVGLYWVNDANLIVAMFAVLQTRAAFVLLNPELPRERLNYIVNDASISLILSNSGQCDDLLHTNQFSLKDIYVHEEKKLPSPNPNLNDLAYICYTSGTTGKPKGVQISHLGLINLSMNYKGVFDLSPKIRSGQYSSINFDAYIGEIFPALVSGSPIVVIPNEIKTHIEKLTDFIDKYQINHLFLPTAIYHLLMNVSINSLKTLIVAGERLIKYNLQNYKIFNAYGPTENTICTTLKELKKDNKITIGRPIANVHTLIVNEHHQLCSIGIAGELLIGGKSLSMGYMSLKNNSDSFVPNPLNNKERLYKSGDICRLLPDGNIEYIGRNDTQVKIRGIRTELREIESILISHESIELVYLTLASYGSDDSRLVGYVVPKFKYHDEKYDRNSWFNTLISFQAQYLPEQIIVKHFIVLKELPLNINGKVDKTRLPKPDFESYLLSEYIEPSTELQKEMSEIWSNILDKKTIGINDNFFDLGGQSLTVIPLVKMIEDKLGIRLSAKDIYQYPTIAQLTATLNQKHEQDIVDYRNEVSLDFIAADIKSYCFKPVKNKLILLTGANGYIGSYLLSSLMKKESNPIYCLIRAENETLGFNKIKSSLITKGLWDDDFQNKIIPILGDLSQEHLGIQQKNYNVLCQKINTIIHSASLMNHLMSYSQLKQANVNGLKELMKFACTGQFKAIHYLSTMNVFGAIPYHQTYDEQTELTNEFHPEAYGYAASKWVADSLCQLASKSGMYSKVFRLGLVLPSLAEAMPPENQWFIDLLIACIKMASYPSILETIKLPIITIDNVANGIVGLIDKSEDSNNTYHLWNQHMFQPKVILDELKKIVPLKKVSLIDWIKHYNSSANLPILPPIEILKNELDEHMTNEAINEHWMIQNLTSDYLFRYQNKHTTQSCSEIKVDLEDLTSDYISYFATMLVKKVKHLNDKEI